LPATFSDFSQLTEGGQARAERHQGGSSRSPSPALRRRWCLGDPGQLPAAKVEAIRSAAILDRYNFRRPHGSLNHRPPASRLTNVAGNYI
jgi:hypothetical protein